jgi:hypothetical protein
MVVRGTRKREIRRAQGPSGDTAGNNYGAPSQEHVEGPAGPQPLLRRHVRIQERADYHALQRIAAEPST